MEDKDPYVLYEIAADGFARQDISNHRFYLVHREYYGLVISRLKALHYIWK